MGLTIHYGLRFKGSAKEAKAQIKKVKILGDAFKKNRMLAEVGDVWEMDFSKGFNDKEENALKGGDEAEGYRWAKIQYMPREVSQANMAKCQGFVVMLWAGAGCEPTNIGLASEDGVNWSGHAFTKTQYAEHFVKAHLTVVAILDLCKQTGILEEVSDEGEYWESRNLEVLGDNITGSTKMIASLSKMLKDSFGADSVVSEIDKSKNIMGKKGGGRL